LWGDGGNDTFYGEQGHDTFTFKYSSEGADSIMDFAIGDKIGIRVANFGDLAVGTLAGAQFATAAGHVAATAEVRFLQDETDYTLWYDADGNGVAATVKLATLLNGYLLGVSDFSLLGE
jgi:Ca2+-binding RTX toxin-like protein